MEHHLRLQPFLPVPGVPTKPWEEWLHDFERFLIAMDYDSISSRRRCAILISSLGDEGQRIVAELGNEALTYDVTTSASILTAASTSTATISGTSMGDHVVQMITHLKTTTQQVFSRCDQLGGTASPSKIRYQTNPLSF